MPEENNHLFRLPSALYVGQKIKINGSIPENFDRATINFQSTTQTSDEPEIDNKILLHFDIRSTEDQSTVSIVRNHFDEGWGDEETSDWTLEPGNFEAQITIGEEKYEISLNGEQFCSFVHRLNMDEVKYIFICHDVVVNSVTLDGQQLSQ